MNLTVRLIKQNIFREKIFAAKEQVDTFDF